MKTLSIIAILLFPGSVFADPSVFMDAAEQKDGVIFSDYAGVRVVIDNTEGVEDMTNVRFTPTLHGGAIDHYGAWSWADPDNPWFGAPGAQDTIISNFISYTQGNVYYPNGEWGPYFQCLYLPGHPNFQSAPDPGDEWILNYFGLYDTVPAGFRWDAAVKMTGTVDLFSTAEGQLNSDGASFVLYDDDPEPQTISGLSTLLGDANNDGVVSADDYAEVQLRFGNLGVPGLLGDANGDAMVSADDYGSIQLHFGDEQGATIPEPAGVMIFTGALLALVKRK